MEREEEIELGPWKIWKIEIKDFLRVKNKDHVSCLPSLAPRVWNELIY